MNHNLYDMLRDAEIKNCAEQFWAEITPELASALLESSNGNRRIKRMRIENMKKDLANGNWCQNGETIKLSADENSCLRLDDGHHRCISCIESGKPFITLIVINSPNKRYIDNGTPRSFADSVILDDDFAKLDKCLSSNIVVAIARVVLNRFSKEKYSGTSNAITKDFIQDHSDGLLFTYNQRKGVPSRLGKSPIWAAVFSAYESGYEYNKLCEFCKILKTGEYSSDDALPIIRFRNWALAYNGSGYEAQKESFMRAQYALKSFNDGNSKAKCKVAQTEFYTARA